MKKVNDEFYSVDTELCAEDNELCTCIAAGGCTTSPGSSCRIMFCDGTVESSAFNSKPDNITTITQPCPEPGVHP